ncbi:MAG: nucleotide exchange factor GrpE [Fibrobacter sp.]|nr:nucleotide exchange factor GrpE [Fibrobacter sp.]
MNKKENKINNEETVEEAKDSAAETDSQGSVEKEEQSADDSAESSKSDLQKSLEAAEETIKSLEDRQLRLHAEFENYRRRTAREQLDIIETANAKLLEKLSEVLDNFERAFSEENKTSNHEAFEKGMQLIHEQFQKVLTDAGLEAINPVGEEFDPNSQEAFMKQPSDSVPENHVLSVFQKGYRIKHKIIKTAKVIVSAGS